VSKSSGKLYWYSPEGDILAETDASGSTQNEYVFFGGDRVAVLPSGGSPAFYAEDFLGSSRVIVQPSGTACYDADFTPYGGERPYTNACQPNYKFEGKERDTETGNDDFDARYYNFRYGRWLSSDWSDDPEPVPYANFTNPQTLNLYSMVQDDPESFADLDGHQCRGSSTGGVGCQSGLAQGPTPQQQGGGVTPGLKIPLWMGILNWLLRGGGDSGGGGGDSTLGHFLTGAGKEVYNEVTPLASFNSGTMLTPAFTVPIPPKEASNATESVGMTATAIGVSFIPGAGEEEAGLKAVSLPGWKSVAIDIEHVLSGHTAEGERALQSGTKDLFPSGMSSKQIERAIRQAYRYSSKAGASQGDRVLLQGRAAGLTIRMWLNTATKTIETAWPK
jgi:RHS repeat-associated protein